MADPTNAVQEMQGLYGPFTIAERVVQKIWLRLDFDQDGLRLLDGRRLVIRAPGGWNLLGGPDFHQARLIIEGMSLTGDVEVHFNVSDWRAHGHARDRAYDKVVLHVVLFPPDLNEPAARSGDGREIPTLVLLPLLHRSLEEYASDEALENLTARDAAERIAGLASLPRSEMISLLRQGANARWTMKRSFAAMRISKLGWNGAVHHTALEVLGYRRNRAVMLSVAARHDLREWGRDLAPDEIFTAWLGRWQLQGVRPANHPRLRLRQYHAWAIARPDWPARLRDMAIDFSVPWDGTEDTGKFRQKASLPLVRKRISYELANDTIKGTRLDTLICDGLLPLLSSYTGLDLWPHWFHWFTGDVPLDLRKSLTMLGAAGQGGPPFCHGWTQGLFSWLAERDSRASG